MEPKKTAMIKALEKSLGVVSTAVQKVGISRTLHYNWVNDDAEYREAVEEIDGSALDFAESSLHGAMKNGSVPAMIFYLKCKGKKRGYVERQEIDHSGMKPIMIIDDIPTPPLSIQEAKRRLEVLRSDEGTRKQYDEMMAKIEMAI